VRRPVSGMVLEYKEYGGDKEYEECTQLLASPGKEFSRPARLEEVARIGTWRLSDDDSIP